MVRAIIEVAPGAASRGVLDVEHNLDTRKPWPMLLIAGMISLILIFAQTAPAEAATRTVCAPNRCVTTSQYCYPTSGCGSRLYREVPSTEYCSSSTGCFRWNGKNYRYIGGNTLTAAQRTAVQQCAAGLGVTWLGAIAGGPTGITILGVAVTLWGCSV